MEQLERVNNEFLKVNFKKLIFIYLLVLVCFKVGDNVCKNVRLPQLSCPSENLVKFDQYVMHINTDNERKGFNENEALTWIS